jgi:hypothetical protein
MEKKFRILRLIGSLYKLLGILLAVITVLAALAIFGTSVMGGAVLEGISREMGGGKINLASLFGGVFGGFIVGVGALIYGIGAAVTFYAIGEGIYLVLALEENTRGTALLLKRQLTQASQSSPMSTHSMDTGVSGPRVIPTGITGSLSKVVY